MAVGDGSTSRRGLRADCRARRPSCPRHPAGVDAATARATDSGMGATASRRAGMGPLRPLVERHAALAIMDDYLLSDVPGRPVQLGHCPNGGRTREPADQRGDCAAVGGSPPVPASGVRFHACSLLGRYEPLARRLGPARWRTREAPGKFPHAMTSPGRPALSWVDAAGARGTADLPHLFGCRVGRCCGRRCPRSTRRRWRQTGRASPDQSTFRRHSHRPEHLTGEVRLTR